MGRSYDSSGLGAVAPLKISTLMARELPFIRNCLRLYRVRSADLDDVTQEALVALHRRLPEYDRSRPLRPWMTAFLARGALHYHRDRGRRREILQGTPEPRTCAPDPEETMADRETSDEVQAILDTLDLDRRTVLLSIDVFDMTASETAEALGILENTVKTRLRLARDEFKAKWRRRQLAKGRGAAAVLPFNVASLLAPLREVPPLSEEDRSRITKRFEDSLAHQGASPSMGPAPRRWPRLQNILRKGALHFLCAGIGALGGFAAAVSRPSAPKSHVEEASLVWPTIATKPALPPASTTVLPPKEPAVSTKPPEATPIAAPAAPPPPWNARRKETSALTELNLLSAAQVALDRGNLALARSILATCARRFPRGALADTRRALSESLLDQERRAAAGARVNP